MPATSIDNIAILTESGSHFPGEILTGFQSFFRPSQRWRVYRHGGSLDQQLARLAGQEIDGLWVHPLRESDMSRILKLSLPTVCTSSQIDPARHDLPGIGFAQIDEYAVGKMAAEHLLNKGISRLWSFQMAWLRRHRLQQAGFRDAAIQAGAEYRGFWSDRSNPLDLDSEPVDVVREEQIIQWLDGLEFPCGLFFSDLGYADNCSDLLRLAGRHVPAEVSILSGQDGQIAQFAWPPLSAVQLPLRQLGFGAGKLLAALLWGAKSEPFDLLSPLGVAQRPSTASIASEDPVVIQAMGHIDRHALDPCSVEDVLAAAGCSRSYLDNAFKDVLGRTVFQEIRRRQIEAAKQVLVETDQSMLTVAGVCGFGSAQRFSLVFKQETGQSPSAYRRQFAKR